MKEIKKRMLFHHPSQSLTYFLKWKYGSRKTTPSFLVSDLTKAYLEVCKSSVSLSKSPIDFNIEGLLSRVITPLISHLAIG